MTRDRATSILDRLRHRARARGEDFQVVLARFGVERTLYRLSISRYADAFVLKGAQLLYARAEERYRPTRDLDLLGFVPQDEVTMRSVFLDLCQMDITAGSDDDAMEFDPASLRVDVMREAKEDSGVRVRLLGHLGRTRIPLQIDVGFGDTITPAPETIEFPTLLGMPRPVLKAYPLETVVAEKFESLSALGTFTSRVKDIYDLWRVKNSFELEHETVSAAIAATFQRRGTQLDERPDALGAAFYSDPVKIRLWNTFLDRANVEAPPLREVCEELAIWFADMQGALE